jgi:hypothetical protein
VKFRNAILAGEQLVRRAIRSANYVAGVAGWRIGTDGSAEFNDATLRGSLVTNNGSIIIGPDPDVVGIDSIQFESGIPGGYDGRIFSAGAGLSINAPHAAASPPEAQAAIALQSDQDYGGGPQGDVVLYGVTHIFPTDGISDPFCSVPAFLAAGALHPMGPFMPYLQADSSVVDNSIDPTPPIAFDVPFPNGIIAVLPTLGDNTGFTSVGSVNKTVNGFDVFPLGAVGLCRVDWLAVGY